MKTALHLREYEDILNLEDVYSLLGSFYYFYYIKYFYI